MTLSCAAIGLIGILSAPCAPIPAATQASFTPAWQALRMGAGGQITDINYQASDGTTLIRTDTYGGYFYRTAGSCTGWGGTFAAPCWEQVVTATSIPSPTISIPYSLNLGVVELIACKSNTNVGYMLWNGFLWVTTSLQSASRTWVKTTQATAQDPNSGPKDEGPFLYCDPVNPNIIYIGTPSSGVFKSTNGTSGGSATFASVAAVGTATSGKGHIFAFDPNSSSVGSVTQHFMICTYGTGCYETTNGGTSYTLTSSTPTTFEHIICDKFSQFAVVNGSTTLFKYVTTAWTTATMPDTGQALSEDPASAALATNKIAVTRSGSGDLMLTANNGTSWTGPAFNQTKAATGSQPGWMGSANQQSGGALSLNTIGAVYDSSSNIRVAAGIGVWKAVAPISASATPWLADSVGIEQLVGIQAIVAPGNSPVVSVWDRGFFSVFNPDVYPSFQYTNVTSNSFGSVDQIVGGWNIDYASAAPNFFTGWAISNIGAGTAPATSSDGPTNWTTWAAIPAASFYGGNIAASTTTNWVTVPGQNEPLAFTTNAGASWALSTIAGSPNFVGNTGVRQALAVDRVTASNYCAVDSNQNFYSSTDGGATFTKRINAGTVDGVANADIFVSVPGQAGNFFYTVGSQSGAPSNVHLWKITKTTNECDTATNVNTNLKEVQVVGFGAPLPGGGGYPTIYAYGWLSNVLGLYQNTDGATTTTWTLINVPASQQTWPGNSLDFVTWVAGDPNVYGRVYVCFRGSGCQYIDTADACPWVNFSSVKPNAALTGTVTLTAAHSGLVPVSGVTFKVDSTTIATVGGGAGPFSTSWNASGVTPGAHTLTVEATGNCSTKGSFSFPITTSANDNWPMAEVA